MSSNDRPSPTTPVELPFAEVIDFQEGPGILAKDFRATGVPLIRLAGLSGGSLLDGCNYLEPEMVARKWSHFRLQEGDTLLSTSASLGRVARVSEPGVGAIPYTGIIRLRPRDERLLPDFIQYLVADQHFQHQVEAMGAGSVMKHFGPTHLRSMTLMVPCRADQERIVRVLGSLDDKIGSNKRLASLLGQVVDTVFAHEIVRSHDTKGWSVGDLTTIARFVNGKAFTKHASEAGRPVLRIKELNGGLTNATICSQVEAEEDNIARHHDLLFSWSGSLDLYRWHGRESLINQHIFKVVPIGDLPDWFAAGWIRYHMPEFQRIARDKATTMGHIKREHLKAATVQIPPKRILRRMDSVLSPLVAMTATLAAETIKLGEIRRALVPRLLAGQERVHSDGVAPELALSDVAA